MKYYNNKDGRNIGKHKNFFNVLKYTNIEKYEYIGKLGNGDITKGYMIYLKEASVIKNKLEEIYYELLDKKSIIGFSRYLKKHNMYNHENAFSSTISRFVGRLHSQDMSFDSYKKYKKILKYYKEYKNEVE